MAKYFASEVALAPPSRRCGSTAATATPQEFVLERLYRDAPLMAIGEGTNDIQRMVIAKSLISGTARVGW